MSARTVCARQYDTNTTLSPSPAAAATTNKTSNNSRTKLFVFVFFFTRSAADDCYQIESGTKCQQHIEQIKCKKQTYNGNQNTAETKMRYIFFVLLRWKRKKSTERNKTKIKQNPYQTNNKQTQNAMHPTTHPEHTHTNSHTHSPDFNANGIAEMTQKQWQNKQKVYKNRQLTIGWHLCFYSSSPLSAPSRTSWNFQWGKIRMRNNLRRGLYCCLVWNPFYLCLL